MLFLEWIGNRVLAVLTQMGSLMLWMGQCFRQVGAFGACLLNSRSTPGQRASVSLAIYQMAHLGVDSLPIVGLTILFTGMVIALQTATEFVKYGASSSVGGLVALSMGRELCPVLTGVVVAGRVGAAIAAEIGTMKVTEQIDALRVMAVNPVRYLVVPRLLACSLMLPVLVVFSNMIGTVGGFLVGVFYAGISSHTYILSIKAFTHLYDVGGGLIKAVVFGAIVALVGCYKGFAAEQGAEGVGKATTSSVVTAIVCIFIANYLLSAILFR